MVRFVVVVAFHNGGDRDGFGTWMGAVGGWVGRGGRGTVRRGREREGGAGGEGGGLVRVTLCSCVWERQI